MTIARRNAYATRPIRRNWRAGKSGLVNEQLQRHPSEIYTKSLRHTKSVEPITELCITVVASGLDSTATVILSLGVSARPLRRSASDVSGRITRARSASAWTTVAAKDCLRHRHQYQHHFRQHQLRHQSAHTPSDQLAYVQTKTINTGLSRNCDHNSLHPVIRHYNYDRIYHGEP